MFPYPKSQTSIKTTRALNLLSFIAVVVVNALAAQGFIQKDTRQISNDYPTQITPSGYAFSIWGLIYFFLAVFVVNQLRPSTYSSDLLNKNVGYFFILSCIFNFTWIFVWHYEVADMIVSAIAIGLIWLSLVKIYISFPKVTETWLDYITIVLPFSFYTAWITAASTLNWYIVSFALTGTVVNGSLSVVGLVVVGIVSLSLVLKRLDPAFAGVITWALIAIHRNDDIPKEDQVKLSALVLAIIIAVVGGIVWVWNIRNLIVADKKRRILP